MQIARVVVVRVIVDGVLGVTVDVHIGHDEVLVIYVAIFVVIFCNRRCTLYRDWTVGKDFVEVLAGGLMQRRTARPWLHEEGVLI